MSPNEWSYESEMHSLSRPKPTADVQGRRANKSPNFPTCFAARDEAKQRHGAASGAASSRCGGSYIAVGPGRTARFVFRVRAVALGLLALTASDLLLPSEAAAEETDAPAAPPSTEAPAAESTGETEGVSPEADATSETTESAASETESTETDSVVAPPGSSLFAQSVSGGGESSESGDVVSSGVSSSSALEFNGYTRGDLWVGKVPGFATGDIKAAYGELGLKVGIKKGEFGGAYAEPRFRYGRQGDEQRLFVDLREAYVDAYFGDLDLRLGHQIIVWGRADALNPTNNLTPSDLRVRSPNEDDRRVGNVGARAFYNLTPVRIEAVWMPIYSPTEIPTEVFPDYVAFAEPDFPKPELGKSLYAGRVHLELAAFEMSVSYLHGPAPLPALAYTDYTVGPDSKVLISRTAYQHDVIGFDFSTAIGDDLGVRSEVAYRKPADPEKAATDPTRAHLPNPDVQYVLGLDRSFGSVSAVAQYMGRYVFDWSREPVPAALTTPEALQQLTAKTPQVTANVEAQVPAELARRSQTLFQQLAEVQHLASLRLEWLTAHDTVALSAIGLYNFTTTEWLLFPKMEYRITDDMTATVGAEIYAGPDETMFGLIDAPLSAGYGELRVAF